MSKTLGLYVLIFKKLTVSVVLRMCRILASATNNRWENFNLDVSAQWVFVPLFIKIAVSTRNR